MDHSKKNYVGGFLLQTLIPKLMPIHSIAILLLYPTRPTIFNRQISYQHHTILMISHFFVYYIFNKSCPEGTGSYGFPGWFLKLISPVNHLQQLHQTGFFSSSKKDNNIHPIEKRNNPHQLNQYCPISITLILSRIPGKYIV